MAIQTNQPQALTNQSDAAVSTYQVVSKHWKLEPLFKLLSYIFYGFLFGMLPASFKFAKIPVGTPNAVEVSGVVAILGLSVLSISVIFWLFKGDIKRHMPIIHYGLHIFNAILLVMGIFIINFFPIGGDTLVSTVNAAERIILRQFILMVLSISHAVLLAIALAFIFRAYKKLFPLSWSRIGFAQAVVIIASLTNIFIWLASRATLAGEFENQFVLLMMGLMIYVLAFIIFVFALSYIKVYRDILLGERTDWEIESINNWENAKSLALIASAMAAITFIVASFWTQGFSFDLMVIVEVTLDVILFTTYASMAFIAKHQERKQIKHPTKPGRFIKIFKSIDNILLVEVMIWIVLIKTTVIEGMMIANMTDVQQLQPNAIATLYLNALIAFAFVILLSIIGPLLAINIPNIKNMWVSILSIAGAILLSIFTIVFTTVFNANTTDNPVYLPLFMLLTFVGALSIALVIRIIMVSKIFKPQNRLLLDQLDQTQFTDAALEAEIGGPDESQQEQINI